MFLNSFSRIKFFIALQIKKIFIFFYSFEFKSFGKNNIFWFPIKILGKENISVGNNCAFNAFVHIWGSGGVEIGNNVMIASHVVLTSVTHDYNNPSIRYSELIYKKIIIEDDVWIGAGAIILPGVKIGEGAVVGAGAVVTKDVEARSIVAGNPARVIKLRNF